MNAIQFESVIQNDTIRIPKQYKGWGASPVLVTIIPTSEVQPSFVAKVKQKPSGINEFPALLNTRGWKFDRDEANERECKYLLSEDMADGQVVDGSLTIKNIFF